MDAPSVGIALRGELLALEAAKGVAGIATKQGPASRPENASPSPKSVAEMAEMAEIAEMDLTRHD